MKVNKNTYVVKAIYIKIMTSYEKMFNMKGVGDILRFPKSQRSPSYDVELSKWAEAHGPARRARKKLGLGP